MEQDNPTSLKLLIFFFGKYSSNASRLPTFIIILIKKENNVISLKNDKKKLLRILEI